MIFPSVTLIISTYNWPEALNLSLKSVVTQTVLPTEVIIADDGSKEETRRLIESFQKDFPCPLIHVWHEDTGFRLAEIRNKAIAKSSGEYIIQTDGDTILEKHFIEDHLKMSQKRYFIVGSRTMLNEKFSKKLIEKNSINVNIFSKDIENRFNAFRIPFLSRYYKFGYKKKNPYYGRGCNMSFWKDDLIAVNGYNEDMTGWGKEDSELIARLINSEYRKIFIKFRGILYHIWHPLSSRKKEIVNTQMFESAVRNQSKWATNGLSKYL